MQTQKMQTYQARAGERLDSIYTRFYGEITLNSYESGYNAFCLANYALLSSREFSGECRGGEIIRLPALSQEDTKQEVLGLWE